MITEPTPVPDEVMAVKIYASVRAEQEDRRQLQRLQDELLDTADPTHVNLSRLLERTKI